MKRLGHRPQRTLAASATLFGRGFLTGRRIQIRFRPAPPDTGHVFVRTDLQPAAVVHATSAAVSGTARRTTIGQPAAEVGLVEHVLAALAGLRIDNCRIELDGPEPPGFDGSAAPFVEALLDAGTKAQDAPRFIWTVSRAVTVHRDRSTLTIHPADANEMRVSYLLDYGLGSPIAQQRHTIDVSPESFRRELAGCRTFVLDHEADELQRQGIGRHIARSEILVFGPRGPIENKLKYGNEPARHKILDIVGDLALFGGDLRGHIVACRSGHPLNIALVRTLDASLPESSPRERLVRAA